MGTFPPMMLMPSLKATWFRVNPWKTKSFDFSKMVDDISLDQYRYDYEIVRSTAEQVIKDFGTHSIEITFSGNPLTAFDELLQQLIPVLDSLAKTNPSKLSALLYRIDLEEAKTRNLPTGKDRIPQMALLILQREFKKVLIRKYFSEKGKS